MQARFHLLLVLVVLLLARNAFAIDDSLIVRPPRSFDNLTIFLIAGPDEVHHPYITLEQALQNGRAVIHENNSQTLWIENRSDSDLYIQSADIIKGGQQDRMIASDMILAAHDTSRDLHVYCVERGRSTKRGDEPVETFSASNEMAPLRHMRVVANHELTGLTLTSHIGGLTAPDPEQLQLLQAFGRNREFNMVDDAAQESVWHDVATTQSALTSALKDSITRNPSPTSLELALESSQLVTKRSKFEKRFGDIASDDDRAIGAIYAIEGKIVGGDLYGSHTLFSTMWPKILRAISTEAIASPRQEPQVDLGIDSVQDYLDAARHGKTANKLVNPRTQSEITDSQKSYLFITRDSKYPAGAVHRAYSVK